MISSAWSSWPRATGCFACDCPAYQRSPHRSGSSSGSSLIPKRRVRRSPTYQRPPVKSCQLHAGVEDPTEILLVSSSSPAGRLAERAPRDQRRARRRPAATAPHDGERANGQRHKHQGDEGAQALNLERSKTWHLGGSVRSALPEPPTRNDRCLPEPVKSAYGVATRWATPTLDRTRPTGWGPRWTCHTCRRGAASPRALLCSADVPYGVGEG
jgi:hypothetical protein